MTRYIVAILYNNRLIGDTIHENYDEALKRAHSIRRTFEHEGETGRIEILVLEEKKRYIIVGKRRGRLKNKEKNMFLIS